MWAVLGIAAMITAALNVVWTMRGRDAKWFRFSSLSFTCLTMCAFYHQSGKWIVYGDWSALMDVVPSMSKALWVLVIGSILINSVSLFKKPNV